MHLFSVLSFLCGLGVVSAYISTPFYSQQIFPDKSELGLYGEFAVGEPAQKVKLYLYLRPLPYSPMLKKGKECTDGVFKRKKSSSFALDKVVKDPEGNKQKIAYGRDVFNMPGGPRLSNTKVEIKEGGDCTYGGLSFGRSNTNWSLVRDYLLKQKNPVAIFAFKEVGNNENEKISGTLIMGDYAKDRCNNDWIYTNAVPTAEIGEDWGIKVDQIDIGSYSNVATTNMEFKRVTFGFGVPASILSAVKQNLNIDSNNKVKCDTNIQIKLKVSGKTLNIEPHVYADLSTKDKKGNCVANVYDSKTTFHMPITFFRGRCQLLNYQKNQVAFATTKPFTEDPKNDDSSDEDPETEEPPKKQPKLTELCWKCATCARAFLTRTPNSICHDMSLYNQCYNSMYECSSNSLDMKPTGLCKKCATCARAQLTGKSNKLCTRSLYDQCKPMNTVFKCAAATLDM